MISFLFFPFLVGNADFSLILKVLVWIIWGWFYSIADDEGGASTTWPPSWRLSTLQVYLSSFRFYVRLRVQNYLDPMSSSQCRWRCSARCQAINMKHAFLHDYSKLLP